LPGPKYKRGNEYKVRASTTAVRTGYVYQGA